MSGRYTSDYFMGSHILGYNCSSGNDRPFTDMHSC